MDSGYNQTIVLVTVSCWFQVNESLNFRICSGCSMIWFSLLPCRYWWMRRRNTPLWSGLSKHCWIIHLCIQYWLWTAVNSSGHTCMDVNECHANIHGCTHKCHNALGFYNCSCNSGYVLGLDGRSCNGKKAIIIFVIQKHMILYISIAMNIPPWF